VADLRVLVAIAANTVAGDETAEILPPAVMRGTQRGSRGQNQYGSDVMTTSLQTADVTGDDHRCHLATPVRFGRRRTDQVGHLLLASGWLQFRGTVDLNIPWAEVAGVACEGLDLVVSLYGTRRILRFGCQTESDASRATVTASHLADLAQSDPLQPA
jgi:hypothetical protein